VGGGVKKSPREGAHSVLTRHGGGVPSLAKENFGSASGRKGASARRQGSHMKDGVAPRLGDRLRGADEKGFHHKRRSPSTPTPRQQGHPGTEVSHVIESARIKKDKTDVAQPESKERVT